MTTETATNTAAKLIGAPVIMRSSTSGGLCGRLAYVNLTENTLTLKDAYRLRYVVGADFTGEGLPRPLHQHRIGPKLCKVVAVGLQSLEITPASEKAYASVVAASLLTAS